MKASNRQNKGCRGFGDDESEIIFDEKGWLPAKLIRPLLHLLGLKSNWSLAVKFAKQNTTDLVVPQIRVGWVRSRRLRLCTSPIRNLQALDPGIVFCIARNKQPICFQGSCGDNQIRIILRVTAISRVDPQVGRTHENRNSDGKNVARVGRLQKRRELADRLV
jgi:hypothetical protein